MLWKLYSLIHGHNIVVSRQGKVSMKSLTLVELAAKSHSTFYCLKKINKLDDVILQKKDYMVNWNALDHRSIQFYVT